MKYTKPLKIHPFIRNLLIAAILIFICFSIPWAFVFWEHWAHVTSEDFANFGDYMGGVLNPTFTLVSAIVIGFQIVRTTENQKLERLLRDYDYYLKMVMEKSKELDVEETEDFAMVMQNCWEEALTTNARSPKSKIHRAISLLVDDEITQYEKYHPSIMLVESLSFTLKQIQDLDPLAHKVALNTLRTVIDSRIITCLELINYWHSDSVISPNHDFIWINDRGQTTCERLRAEVEAKATQETPTNV